MIRYQDKIVSLYHGSSAGLVWVDVITHYTTMPRLLVEHFANTGVWTPNLLHARRLPNLLRRILDMCAFSLSNISSEIHKHQSL